MHDCRIPSGVRCAVLPSVLHVPVCTAVSRCCCSVASRRAAVACQPWRRNNMYFFGVRAAYRPSRNASRASEMEHSSSFPSLVNSKRHIEFQHQKPLWSLFSPSLILWLRKLKPKCLLSALPKVTAVIRRSRRGDGCQREPLARAWSLLPCVCSVTAGFLGLI